MEDDLKFWKMEEDLKFWKMEDDLNFNKREFNLNIKENERLHKFSMSCFMEDNVSLKEKGKQP